MSPLSRQRLLIKIQSFTHHNEACEKKNLQPPLGLTPLFFFFFFFVIVFVLFFFTD